MQVMSYTLFWGRTALPYSLVQVLPKELGWTFLVGGCVDFLLPNLSGVSAELKSCFDSLALLAPPTQLNFTNHTILHIPVIRIPDSNKAARLL